jgi:glycosyltransferase involved in cell wall biosynthesis
MSTGILITTRNRAKQLAIGLKSIAEKMYHFDTDIVIVDDSSTDNSDMVIKFHKSVLSRALTINRNGGYRKNPSEVLNYGHRQIHTDAVIEQGGEICHLTNCVKPLSAICKPGVVALARVYHGSIKEYEQLRQMILTGQYNYVGDYKPETYQTNGDRWRVPIVDGFRLYCGMERPVPFMFCGAIWRGDFEAVGGYDESLPRRNDEDLANRLIKHGVNFVFSGKAIAFHLEHGKS